MSKRRFVEESFRKEPWFKALMSAILSCKSEDDIANFLRDVATLSELKALSERLEIAKQLAQGISYRQVAINTGASTTTVTRVAHFLENGEGGYRKFLGAHRHHRSVSKPVAVAANPIEMNPVTEQSDEETMKVEKAVPARPVSVLQKYL